MFSVAVQWNSMSFLMFPACEMFYIAVSAMSINVGPMFQIWDLNHSAGIRIGNAGLSGGLLG
jgi:hypothetical protein